MVRRTLQFGPLSKQIDPALSGSRSFFTSLGEQKAGTWLGTKILLKSKSRVEIESWMLSTEPCNTTYHLQFSPFLGQSGVGTIWDLRASTAVRRFGPVIWRRERGGHQALGKDACESEKHRRVCELTTNEALAATVRQLFMHGLKKIK